VPIGAHAGYNFHYTFCNSNCIVIPLGNGFMVSEGETWKRQRQIVQ